MHYIDLNINFWHLTSLNKPFVYYYILIKGNIREKERNGTLEQRKRERNVNLAPKIGETKSRNTYLRLKIRVVYGEILLLYQKSLNQFLDTKCMCVVNSQTSVKIGSNAVGGKRFLESNASSIWGSVRFEEPFTVNCSWSLKLVLKLSGIQEVFENYL